MIITQCIVKGMDKDKNEVLFTWTSASQQWIVSPIQGTDSISFYPKFIKAITNIYEIIRELNKSTTFTEADKKDAKN